MNSGFRFDNGQGDWYHTASHRATSRQSVSVSWSPAQGQYRKYVGHQIGRNGKPQPKCWHLGGDEREAVRRAVELVAEWTRLKAAGATVWPLKAASGENNKSKRAKDEFVDVNDRSSP